MEVKKYETQIDQLVYNLYGLTDKEIEVVKNSTTKGNKFMKEKIRSINAFM